jgi:hypothetical protein
MVVVLRGTGELTSAELNAHASYLARSAEPVKSIELREARLLAAKLYTDEAQAAALAARST